MKQEKILTEQNQKNNQNELSASYHELYAGPIPHPDILLKYKNIDSDLPNRIVTMAEKVTDSDIREADRRSTGNFIALIFGQIFTFLLGIAGMLAGIYFANKGYEGGSIASIIGGFSPILISAISNFKKK